MNTLRCGTLACALRASGLVAVAAFACALALGADAPAKADPAQAKPEAAKPAKAEVAKPAKAEPAKEAAKADEAKPAVPAKAADKPAEAKPAVDADSDTEQRRDPFKITAIMISQAVRKEGGLPQMVDVSASNLPVIRMTGVMEVDGQRLATVFIDGIGSIVLQKDMTYAFLKGDTEGRAKLAPQPGKGADARDGKEDTSKVISFKVKEIDAKSVTLVTMDGVEVNICLE